MIDLISVHIPKTGGSSLFRVLKQVYSRDHVLRLNTVNLLGRAREGMVRKEEIPAQTLVIHGHLRVAQLDEIIDRDKTRIITWMRDPVERVISNYYHSMYRIRMGRAEERKMSRVDYSLMEYASLEESRNIASFQLEGCRLEDLFFIGLYEHIDEDFEILKHELLWSPYITMPHAKDGGEFKADNDCTTKLEDITPAMREELAALNKEDIELYREAKALRKRP